MATGWRRHGNGRHDSKPGLRAKTRRSGPACYRKGSLPAAGWRKEQYWRNATYTKSQTLPKRAYWHRALPRLYPFWRSNTKNLNRFRPTKRTHFGPQIAVALVGSPTHRIFPALSAGCDQWD